MLWEIGVFVNNLDVIKTDKVIPDQDDTRQGAAQGTEHAKERWKHQP